MDASRPDPGERPADLSRDVYKASEGRNPAGVLPLVAFQLQLMAEQAGVAPDPAGYRPETAADRVPSGRAIVADTCHLHSVAQDSPRNPDRAAARDAAVAAGDQATVRRQHDEAVAAVLTVLRDAAAAGFVVQFEMSAAGAFAREE